MCNPVKLNFDPLSTPIHILFKFPFPTSILNKAPCGVRRPLFKPFVASRHTERVGQPWSWRDRIWLDRGAPGEHQRTSSVVIKPRLGGQARAPIGGRAVLAGWFVSAAQRPCHNGGSGCAFRRSPSLAAPKVVYLIAERGPLSYDICCCLDQARNSRTGNYWGTVILPDSYKN
jgi:hypothetical protein